MSYALDNWGSFVSLLGVFITVGGLTASLLAVYRAGKARDAAAAAREASHETRTAITRVLTIVDLERAVALVQRLKELHRSRKWEACLEHYQPLRNMLGAIDARHPAATAELHATLQRAITQIKVIEESIYASPAEGLGATRERSYFRTLNTIQVNLEELARSAQS